MRLPGKAPMRALNDRPPLLETPWDYYRQDLTPNEAFYVRWHLEVIPTDVDLRTWRLKIGGSVDRPLELSMDDLRRMEPTSLVAVNQCSGNSRSFFAPRVAGGQWRNGAMGNARWTGVPLRDLLRRAGVQKGAAQVTFRGLDRGPLPSAPDFVKALDVDRELLHRTAAIPIPLQGPRTDSTPTPPQNPAASAALSPAAAAIPHRAASSPPLLRVHPPHASGPRPADAAPPPAPTTAGPPAGTAATGRPCSGGTTGLGRSRPCTPGSA
jgi:hypothetical protein